MLVYFELKNNSKCLLHAYDQDQQGYDEYQLTLSSFEIWNDCGQMTPNESNDWYEWLHVSGKVHGLKPNDENLMDFGRFDS